MMKFDKFKLMLSKIKNKPGIVVIGETKLKPRFPINLYNLHGYNRLAACRSPNERGTGGGGLLVFIRKEITVISHQLISTGGNSKSSFEKISVALKTKNTKLNLVAYYRPPENGNIEEFMQDLEATLSVAKEKTCIVGDINLNATRDTKQACNYLDLLKSYDFSVMNDIPTRNQSGKIIDHFLCNFSHESSITNCTITLREDFSDHCLIMTSLSALAPPQVIKTKTMPKTNYVQLRKHFATLLETADLYSCVDPNLITANLTKAIQSAIHKSTTVIKVHVKNDNIFDWYNENVRRAASVKQKLAKKVRRNRGNVAAKRKLKEASARLRAIMKEEKRSSDISKFNCRNQKQLWKNINEVLGRDKSKTIHALQFGDDLVDDEETMAERLNKLLIETVEGALKNLPGSESTCKHAIPVHSLVLCPPDIEEVTLVLSSLKKSSCGHDNINSKHMKSLQDLIAPCITFLIGTIFQTGIYPDCLKIAVVTPINKSGDYSNPGDYRPISVLPTLNKIIEKIMHKRITDYLEKYNHISSRQYGFRKRCGTEVAAIELTHCIQQEIDKKNKVSLLFMDLSKAFDIVDHKLLIESLRNIGVRGIPLKIFESYLENRMQIVKIGAKRSKMMRIRTGVVQGSVLGPLLFNIFINDVTRLNLSGDLFLYADDIVLVNSHSPKEPICNTIQQDMDKILGFINGQRLLLNPNKTHLMIAHSPHSKISLEDSVTLNNGMKVPRVENIKYLGLVLDHHLKWDAHCAHLTSKLSSAAGMLWKLRRRLPLKVMKSIYQTLFETHLNYLSPIWTNASDTFIKPLQVIQNRALRNVFDLDRRTNRVQMYLNLVENCLPLRAIGFLNTATFIYNASRNSIRTNLSFCRITNTRSQRRPQVVLKESSSKSSHGKKSISAFGVKLFNSIPNDIKAVRHMHAFKWTLRCHLRNEKFLESCFNNDYLRKFS
jgi:exonuclease III